MSYKKEKAPPGTWFLVWGCFFVVFALGTALPPAKVKAAFATSADVDSTQATIVSVDVDSRVSGGKRARIKYDCEVNARYQVHGVNYAVSATLSSSSRSQTERECSDFSAGDPHRVLYLRSDPSNASLVEGYFDVPAWTGFMLSLGPLGLVLVWLGERRFAKHKERYGSYRAI